MTHWQNSFENINIKHVKALLASNGNIFGNFNSVVFKGNTNDKLFVESELIDYEHDKQSVDINYGDQRLIEIPLCGN